MQPKEVRCRMTTNPLTITAISLAARDTHDYIKDKKCLYQSLAELQKAGVDDGTAIHMLCTALV
jgi:hypothetical protein